MMRMCKKSDVLSHKLAFVKYVLQTVSLSDGVETEQILPFGYFRDSASHTPLKDINSGWRVTNVTINTAHWIRVITLDELKTWESE